MKPTFRLTAETKRWVESFSKRVDTYGSVIDSVAKRAAENCVKRVKESIYKQTFGSVGVTAKWGAYKRSHGLDPRTLMATKEYVESFEAQKVRDGEYAVTAEMPLHLYLEKKRPHLNPVLRDMKGKGLNDLAKDIVKSIFGG